jgi:hypothetical protein
VPFSPALALVFAALLVLAVPVVSAEGKEIIIPGEKPTTTEKEPKAAPNSAELVKIIEKQDALIKALRARIKGLEEATLASLLQTRANKSMTEAQKDMAAAEKDLNDVVKQASTTTKEEVKSGSHLAAWTPELVCKLSLGIGAFAILSFALVAFLIWQKKNAEQLLRTFGILVIIFAAVFLVVAGYSDTQITPVIGLLGTIAGYLLGRRIEPSNPAERHQSPTQ